MAETVRMVSPDGAEYDIPKAEYGKAFADGLREQKSLIGQAADVVNDSNPILGAVKALTGKQDQLGDLAKRHGQAVLLDAEGHAYVMPADEANQAIVKGGLRAPDLADDRDRALVAKAEASIDPSNQGLRGAIKVGVGSMRSSAVKAATFGAVDPEQDAMTAEERTAWERAKGMHEGADYAGSAVGFAGALVADPLAVGSAAAKVGSAAERAAVGEAGTLAGGIVRGAATGAAVSAPNAARLAVEGDPDKAAEAVLIGAFGGGLIGGAGRGASTLWGKASSKAGEGVSALAKGAEQRLARLEAVEGATLPEATKGEKVVEALASKATGRLAAGAGAMVGGFPGYVVGSMVGEALEAPRAQKAIAGYIGSFAKGLEGVGPAIDRMAKGAGAAAEASSLNAMARLIGSDEGKPRREQYVEVRDKLAELHSDPSMRAETVGVLASSLGESSQHADALNAKANVAIDYLYSQLPKTQRHPGLFSRKQQEQLPSEAQMARFERQVQIVTDPFSVVKELESGTLTRDHVEALRAVYPALHAELIDRVMAKAADPKAPALDRAKRAKLQLLLGLPLDDSASPESVAMYQSFYKQEPEASPQQGKVAALPASQPTTAQKIAAR